MHCETLHLRNHSNGEYVTDKKTELNTYTAEQQCSGHVIISRAVTTLQLPQLTL